MHTLARILRGQGKVVARRCKRNHSSLDEAEPTREQLRSLFISSAIPMVGFGIMDQTIMLQAGNAIDLTIGVTFGFSTLTAAAFGQICSDSAGVLFGGTVESLAKYAGLPVSSLTAAQRTLPVVKQVKVAGSLCGVILGCCIGLLNLLIIDTERSSTLKLEAASEEQEFAFEVEASNVAREDGTEIRVRGPDLDGVLSSMTSALAGMNCSLVTLKAGRGPEHRGNRTIEDIFVVVKHGTDEKIPDDELEDVSMALLQATNSPVNVHTFKSEVRELKKKNAALQSRAELLEKKLQERQVKIVPSKG